MPNCTRIQPKPYKICTGDLRYQLVLYSRTKSAVNTTNVEATLTLSTVATLWAMQRSVNGEEIFNGTDIIGKITDEFYIRYYPTLNINKINIIGYQGNLYNIEDFIPNLEGRRQFSVIRSSKRGTDTLNVNKLANI